MKVQLSSRADFLEDPLDVDRVLLGLAEAHLPRSRDVDGRLPHSTCIKGRPRRRQATTQARVGQARGHEYPSVGLPNRADDVREHRL